MKKSLAEILMAILIVGTLIFSGCLTLNPSITADTDNSTVFKSFSVSEPWSRQKVRVNATLRSTPAAANVTQIAVIQSNGKTFATRQVTSGQTSIILPLPTNDNATLVASNTVNSTTIETLNVSTSGNTIP